ncbi:MAG: hypothetical protein Q4C23_02750 [Mycoplasmatota bacterium]|nr:hypothetical protein [Mycoplasmatota bacterium]
MNKNKIIIICLSLIILASIVTSIYLLANPKTNNSNNEDDIINIDNHDVLKDTKYEELDITNQTITVKNNSSNYLAVIKNNTSNDYKINNLYIIFHQGKSTKEILVLKDTKIPSSGTRTIDLTINSSLSKVTKIEYIQK